MRVMSRFVSAALIAALPALTPDVAAAQQTKKPSTKLDAVRPIPEVKNNRDVFTGSETRIAAMNSVNADCSSGPVPSLRIVTAPKNGEHRLEELTIPVDRKTESSRAACNGKPVSAVGIYYKSKAEFTGTDNIVVDVDFRNGTVRRYIYRITVR